VDYQIAFLETPIGTAKIAGDENGINSISVLDEKIPSTQDIPDCLVEAVKELDAYFKGNLKEFTLKLNPIGTEFQKRVWKALAEVNYGKTRSYMELTKELGDEKAIRAVAAANGKNPLWIVIPCHRIIGSDGSLTGYAGGLWRKQWLLNHEQENKQMSLF